ncbi:MAG: porin family protein [Salinivirgaceae bacterium]|nr:porin family protein [Bacteroidaceae bacterium]MDY0280804.1 porin family protein [Salinivirgaceae bacterium]
MKKIILLSIAMFLLLAMSIAQDNRRDNLLFGIKAGANLANVYDTEGEDFEADSKLGIAAGVFLSIPIGSFLGIQPEVLYSQKGYRSSGSVATIGYEFKHTASYLDIPLLIQLKPHPMLTILAGPQYSYLMKEKKEFDSSVLSTTQEEEFTNDNVRKNILGFIGGVDLDFDPLVLGARVGWDIQNNKGDGTSTIPRYKNVWYQLTIGILF